MNSVDHFEELGVDGWIILKWIMKKYDVKVGLVSSESR